MPVVSIIQYGRIFFLAVNHTIHATNIERQVPSAFEEVKNNKKGNNEGNQTGK